MEISEDLESVVSLNMEIMHITHCIHALICMLY